ncbi:MAG: hypothetical protein WAL50_21115 [Kineosporiaceae bacterium]
MSLSKRDTVATVLVAVAGLLYVLWALGSAPFSLSGTRATGIAVLALGFIASATAVVPTFSQLLHGSKAYLAITSTLGVIAAAAGVQMLLTASETGLAVVMVAMVAMWLLATTHHRLGGRTAPTQIRPPGIRASH